MEHHYRGRKNAVPEGRNIVILKVMLRYLKKIIETDLQIAPFELVSVERTYQREFEIRSGEETRIIRLGGLIDRVDRVGEVIRVIDYKTGNANTGFSSMESLFDGSLSSRNGAALQTLLYSWLVMEIHPGERVAPGLYVMRSLYDKEFDPRLTMGSFSKKEVVDSFSKLEDAFMEKLQAVLSGMFDPANPFVQTDNESICRYCDFSKICSRRTIE